MDQEACKGRTVVEIPEEYLFVSTIPSILESIADRSRFTHLGQTLSRLQRVHQSTLSSL